MDTTITPGSPVAHPHAARASCLGRTCMKWTSDGELSDIDIQLILQRLREVDAQVEPV
ncbi:MULTISPECIES: hypothetical protein [Aphanothece]|uniref:hypothetical protein n=1 Tax=Aphanothece TaxID=1121 RepID=UPI00398EA880